MTAVPRASGGQLADLLSFGSGVSALRAVLGRITVQAMPATISAAAIAR
jgi:hypothetical protein